MTLTIKNKLYALSRLHDSCILRVFSIVRLTHQPTMMSGNTNIYTSAYSPYWWWEDKDDWLKATIIAAPVFAVLGAVLISYRLYARRRTSYIYTPPVVAEDAVYKPTTCGLKRHKELTVELGPDSPSVIIDQMQPMLKPTQQEDLTPA